MRNCIFVWKDDLGQDEAVPAARYISSATCRGCCDFGCRSPPIDGELMEGVHTSTMDGLYPISTLGRWHITIVRIPIGPRPDLCCTDGVFWMFLAKGLPDSLLLIIGMAPVLASLRVAGSPRSEIRFLQSFGEDMQMVEVLKHHSCPDWSDRDHYFSYGPPMGKGLAHM